MKTILFLLFIPFFLFSQTISERKLIISNHNQEYILQLQHDSKVFYKQQQRLIQEYLQIHPHIESELESLQRIEEDGTPIFFTIFNQGSSLSIGTNRMYPGGTLGISVTGQGMLAGVWDGGKIRDTHQEFSGNKIILGDLATSLSSHGTHVTGTVIATGVSPIRKGIAYQAQAKTYDWNSDYDEMLAFGNEGYLVSNHSYGYNTTSLSTAKFGAYDVSSIEIDNVSNAFPFYQVVIAAGNDRNSTTLSQVNLKGGYDLLTGKCTSKNAIVVAGVEEVPSYVDSSSVIMSTFSNYGPTDDGRIKPDISAKGVDVSSCTSIGNSTYSSFNGTSMASPSIAGLVLMLQKHYNNLYPLTYMRASTVRGLICHSAKEAGLNPGPDYEFGWGLANAELAANIITNRNVSSVLEENTLNINETFTKQISISSVQKLSATICWTDPNGQTNVTGDIDNRTPRLKNNLDLKILKDDTIYYPWKLYVEDPTAPAINTEENDVDNVEKVEIPNAQPGVYTIQVTHKGTLTGGSQVFSLIANATNGLNLNTSDYEFDNSIFVYPNPATTILYYQVKNDITIDTVSVTDISGKQIFKASNTIYNAIDISNLSSGVYFVTFTSESNSITKKFIKE
jgi:serine protease AprX